MNPQIPTGDTSKIVQQYYEYVLTRHLYNIKLNRALHLYVSSLQYVYAWAAIMIIFFFLLTYSLNRVHRAHGELYQNTNYIVLTERNGAGSLFTWLIIFFLFLYVIYFGYTSILYGFYY
jgi:ABC-type multidrug transport system permease subunit